VQNGKLEPLISALAFHFAPGTFLALIVFRFTT
jgi:hypothetical protein